MCCGISFGLPRLQILRCSSFPRHNSSFSLHPSLTGSVSNLWNLSEASRVSTSRVVFVCFPIPLTHSGDVHQFAYFLLLEGEGASVSGGSPRVWTHRVRRFISRWVPVLLWCCGPSKHAKEEVDRRGILIVKKWKDSMCVWNNSD